MILPFIDVAIMRIFFFFTSFISSISDKLFIKISTNSIKISTNSITSKTRLYPVIYKNLSQTKQVKDCIECQITYDNTHDSREHSWWMFEVIFVKPMIRHLVKHLPCLIIRTKTIQIYGELNGNVIIEIPNRGIIEINERLSSQCWAIFK